MNNLLLVVAGLKPMFSSQAPFNTHLSGNSHFYLSLTGNVTGYKQIGASMLSNSGLSTVGTFCIHTTSFDPCFSSTKFVISLICLQSSPQPFARNLLYSSVLWLTDIK